MATGWTQKDDRELLSLIQQGSHQAFAMLARRHTERFYRLAYRYMQQREAAEDIVQEAFLKLWEDPGKWKPDRNSQFTTWFYRVVVNLCLDWQKKKRPVELDEAVTLTDPGEAPDVVISRNQQYKLLETEIAHLPERQRTALNLCFAEGLTNQEAAEVMGLNLKALQSLIMRAKIRLKERIKPA